jgi:hypothetical protein
MMLHEKIIFKKRTCINNIKEEADKRKHLKKCVCVYYFIDLPPSFEKIKPVYNNRISVAHYYY